MTKLILCLFTVGGVVIETSPAPLPPALQISGADDSEFFGLLDFNRTELAAVRKAVEAFGWLGSQCEKYDSFK